jgi:endoglucanase
VHLRGVNRSGTEYQCVHDYGIFDGPSSVPSVHAMAAWHINVVRIPLNEDCWLGINGAPAAYSGQRYVDAIVRYVDLLHRNGMYAELALMWGAPGNHVASYQPGGPDADHAPAMWSSLAATFANDPNVLLAPWGETSTGWECFMRTGCTDQATYDDPQFAHGYPTASMQQAVDVMRHAGYRGVIVIPGINYANDLSRWLAYRPVDPLHQLMAEAHVYGKNTCGTPACFDSNYAAVARRVPVVFGETGETYDSSDCGSSHISQILGWADAHGVGYETWTWDTWGNCGALISDYRGTPRAAYGAFVKAYYAKRAATTHGPPR